jgi:hypothetical protein
MDPMSIDVRNARIRGITILWTTLVASSCFRYVPAELGALPAGDQVRLELTRVGFAQLPELPNVTGPDLNGTLIRWEPDRLFLRVPVNVRLDGLVTQTVQQELTIPASDIVQMEHRVLSRGRTALSVGGGLVTLGVIFLSFTNGGDDTPELPERPREEEAGVGFGRRTHCFRNGCPIGLSIPIR